MAAVNFLASKMKQFFRTVGRHNQNARKVNRMRACTRAKNETSKDSLENHHQVSIRLEKPYY